MLCEKCYDWWRSTWWKFSKFMISCFMIMIYNTWLWCFKILYDHNVCHLINQVLSKVKTVSYRLFSLCRPKGIKRTVLMKSYDVFGLSREDLVHPRWLLVERVPRDTYTKMRSSKMKDKVRWKLKENWCMNNIE